MSFPKGAEGAEVVGAEVVGAEVSNPPFNNVLDLCLNKYLLRNFLSFENKHAHTI